MQPVSPRQVERGLQRRLRHQIAALAKVEMIREEARKKSWIEINRKAQTELLPSGGLKYPRQGIAEGKMKEFDRLIQHWKNVREDAQRDVFDRQQLAWAMKIWCSPDHGGDTWRLMESQKKWCRPPSHG